MFGSRRPCPPPGPRGHWLAGNLIAYEQDRLGYLLRAREEHGAIVRFGPRTTIINDPQIAARLLRDSSEAFAVRENVLQQRVSADKSREISDLRTALNPGLRREAASPIEDIVNSHLTAELRTSALIRSDAWSDPMPFLERTIASSVAEFYFGPADATKVQDLVCGLLDALTTVIGNPFALPQAWGTKVRRRIEKNRRDLRARVDSLLEARQARAQGDLASEILARVGGRYPLEAIADMVVASLLAAQRVPAAGAAWLLMLLADHPQTRIQIDPGPPPGAGRPTSHQGGACGSTGPVKTTAEHVVLESMRLYPPTWLITRTSTVPVVVGGYRLPAQHHFMVSPYVLHRDPEQFHEPAAFRPERWTTIQRPPTGYLPFGAGIHVCPGRHMATVVLATIARRLTAGFEIVRESGPITPNARTTLLPDGLRIRLEPRSTPGRDLEQPGLSENQPLALAESPSF